MAQVRGQQSYSSPGPHRSVSSSQRHQPYPTPGGAYKQSGAPRPVQPPLITRSSLREKWSRTFGGPSYLEPGVSNRLVLSLRSPLPAEIDFALERLLQVSGAEPDLLRLHELPGLIEGVLELVNAFIDARKADRLSDAEAFLGVWSDPIRDVKRRRANEAALVLRNISGEKANLVPLQNNKRLRRTITSSLEEGELGIDPDETTELRHHMLEILEVIGDHIPLVLPGMSLRLGHDARPEDLASPSVRLFPLLVSLTRSPDRALVLGAFRCLLSLSLNDKSDAVLAMATYDRLAESTTDPHPIQTAIELLPIADAEISIAVLDYIYQHTLVPANAAMFCSRPDLIHILRLVCTKLHLGARKEILEVVAPMKGAEADEWLKSQPPKHKKRLLTNLPPRKDLTTKLEGEDRIRICAIREPERGLTWMREVFEGNAEGEITQVALWTAYRTEFSSLEPSNPMLPAAEVIKMSTEAFPAALPMVTEGAEKRFIIKGIRIRDRTNMNTIFVCRWEGCTQPNGPNSPASLYWHLHHIHATSTPAPAKCCWVTCPWESQQTDEHLRMNELSLHLRTHVPSYKPPPGYGESPTTSFDANGIIADPVTKMKHERYHAQLDEHGEVTGLGLLACLLLRNIGRTVKTAMGNPAGGASLASLTGGEKSIFEAMSEANEGGAKQEELMSRLEKVDFTGAKKGAEALMALEEKLVSTTVEDHGLGKILGEVLAVVTACRKAPVSNGDGRA